MKIVILDGYTVTQEDLSWDEFEKLGEVTYYEKTAAHQIIPRMDAADIVITSKCPIDKDVIDSNPNLKYIGVIATGYNNINVDYAHQKGVTVTNIPAYSTDSVAQFTFSLLLEVANRIGLHSESVRRGDWEKSPDFCYTLTPQIELAGKTMGIIGYGNIGKKVSKMADVFGMEVLVHSSHIQASNGAITAGNIRFVGIDELLSRSDIISLHCALTDKNREMINKNSIAKMKDGVILINTSRGALVNEHDLAEGLGNGKISQAALDVLPTEPPKNNTPLIKLDNCIITPHIAWDTKEARQRLIAIALNNVSSFLAGKPVNII